jgi:A/G-specific adenine glycosylase
MEISDLVTREYYNTNGLPSSEHDRIARIVTSWFRRNQRALPWRITYDPYLVWLSEVMLQQTRMEVVLRYFDRFLSAFPTLEALARSDEHDVLALWSGLGYYRRARMLREGAIEVVENHAGRLPRSVGELRRIRGIGRYTAGAIASIAFDQRAPIVDGNVARIASRLFGIEQDVIKTAWTHAERLVARARSPRDLNQGLMELGALVCKPVNPECRRCPLTSDCVAFLTSRQAELPPRKAKPSTRAMTIPLYYITDRRGRVLMRRESGQLMNAMFHLPHGRETLFGSAPLTVVSPTLLGAFRHTITNRRIEFQLFAADLNASLRESVDEYTWIDPSELARFPHPSYVAKAVAIATVKSSACAGG